MVSAFTPFTADPQLLDVLIWHLDQNAVSKLRRTNRRMHSLLIRALYRKMDICYYRMKRTIAMYPQAMEALAGHVDDVRELTVGWADLIYLSACIESKIPGYSLAPMTRLTKIDFHFRTPEIICNCPYYPLAYNDPQSLLVWVKWILGLNPMLEDLRAVSLEISNSKDRRLLISAIKSLPRLRRLELVVVSARDQATHLGPELLAACLPTVESFSLGVAITNPENKVTQDELVESEDEDEESEDNQGFYLLRRYEPLPRLKELSLWNMVNGVVTLQDICVVFYQRPNLETLTLPAISDAIDTTALADLVATLCPKIKSVKCDTLGDKPSADLAYKILERLPPPQHVKDIHAMDLD
ncbi:hypothetical protein BGX33_008904 [Mortierella sp. NVP41]|nr:hypothetical protein BGX33_008904 [Mortierella sp. NVP41]